MLAPETTDALSRFYASLSREERVVAAEIATDRMGVALRVAVNELDLDWENAAGRILQDNRAQHAYLMRLGVNRMVKIALEAHARFDAPSVTIQRHPALTAAGLSAIIRLGTIEHGRRVGQSVEAGWGRIEVDQDRFRVVLADRLPDLELHERELARLLVDEGRAASMAIQDVVLDRPWGIEIRRIMHDLVRPFGTHFIGYDTDPRVDDYFFAKAYAEIRLLPGYDAFHHECEFGGTAFRSYKLAAAFVMSVAMKHRVFVDELLRKEPTIRFQDVLTVSVETSSLLEGLKGAVNHFGEGLEGHLPIDEDDARRIFDVLSVGRHNLPLLDRPGAPTPPLVQCSDAHVIRCMAGTGEGILIFLLNSLQHAFPVDYDRARQRREGALQSAMERVLLAELPDLVFRRNVKIRHAGVIVTDVDLVVIDSTTGHQILVQIKHQDPYGDDMAARGSRTRRLDVQAATWVEKVQAWIAREALPRRRATLRVPAGTPDGPVTLLVLARHYAHSLRLALGDQGIVFSNWNQLVTALERLRMDVGSLPTLHGLVHQLTLISRPPGDEFLREPRSDWSVGRLRFRIEQ